LVAWLVEKIADDERTACDDRTRDAALQSIIGGATSAVDCARH
jgi:hypothetical protein